MSQRLEFVQPWSGLIQRCTCGETTMTEVAGDALVNGQVIVSPCTRCQTLHRVDFRDGMFAEWIREEQS